MPHIHIPALLREATKGQDWVKVEGTTVREAIEALERAHPALAGKLIRDSRLAPGYAIAVDGEVSSLGLAEPVTPQTELHFIPAIQGG